MRGAVIDAAKDADAVVMAAAVADFRPATRAGSKLKKTASDPEPLALIRNADILAEISTDRITPGQVVVGFAAETDNVLANGQAKLAAKGCDLLVVNQVGEHLVFGADDTAATILGSDGSVTDVTEGSKERLGHLVWDRVVERLS
jgi:phosphopantothenoylcysteine decarboxylase / phosphopantothenate---cysteine ligase